MTDINSKIDWQAGMELSAQTFKELNDSLNYRQQVMTCIAHSNRIGRLPRTTFDCNGTFVKNIFEIDRMRCTALLTSGKIVQIDEPVKVKVPPLYGRVYYLTVDFSGETVSFHKEGVPYVRPKYSYLIQTLEELQQNGRFPLMRFVIDNGNFSIDNGYIAPCLLIQDDERISQYIAAYADKLEIIGAHTNLEDGEGKRTVLHYAFRLKGYDAKESTHDTMLLLAEMAYAIEYHIYRPNINTVKEIPICNENDIKTWLEWLSTFLDGAVNVLNAVVLEDNSIDYDKLKAEIKAELYEQVIPELFEKLQTELRERVLPDMQSSIKEAIMQYLNDTMHPQLYNDLLEKLDPQLYEHLYQSLYDALYNALYVPQEEVIDEFTPQI